MVRIPQQNDWVAFILVGCMFLYVFMLVSLRRDSTVREFLLQNHEDSANNFLSALIIGFVFTLLLATFLSQYVPLVPLSVTRYSLFGHEINKFGFTFLTLLLFYTLRNIFTYLFYSGTGALRRWERLYFISAKFYFVASLLLLILCVIRYFFGLNDIQVFEYYVVTLAVLFIFKILFYILHPAALLPPKWYYKLLYICTLQIVPVFVLWRILFF